MNKDTLYAIKLLVTGLLTGALFVLIILAVPLQNLSRDKNILTEKVTYLEEELETAEDSLDLLDEYKNNLEEALDKLEKVSTSNAHESYTECLTKIKEDYNYKYYIVNQVATTETGNDDIIYHFIITVYNRDFSDIKTFNCYSVYDGDEFMYVDCDLIK